MQLEQVISHWEQGRTIQDWFNFKPITNRKCDNQLQMNAGQIVLSCFQRNMSFFWMNNLTLWKSNFLLQAQTGHFSNPWRFPAVSLSKWTFFSWISWHLSSTSLAKVRGNECCLYPYFELVNNNKTRHCWNVVTTVFMTTHLWH